ncbi:MAG: hypothetical protein ACXWQJ_04015 [Bdellovibrionota bacterium]
MMPKNSKILACAIAALTIVSCSRRAENKPLPGMVPVIFGPKNEDVEVNFEAPKRQLVAENGITKEQGEMNSADYFRLVDDLNSLATTTQDPKLHKLAEEMYGAFYKSGNTYTTNSFNRFYVEAILGQAQAPAQKQLSIIARDISLAKQKLTILLNDSAATYPWPREFSDLNQAVTAADAYVSWLMKAIPRLGLSEELMRPVTAAIRAEYSRYRPGFAQMAVSLEKADSFAQAVKSVKVALAKFDVKLPEEQAALVTKADKLVVSLDEMETSQDALTLLIDVWRLVPENSREAVFKPVVPELYDYFSDKSDLSLSCLAAKFCINPVLELSKRVGILPKLTEFGVSKIHDQVAAAAKEFLIKSVRSEAASLIPQIPVQARSHIVTEAEKYQALIAGIQSDFAGFGRSHARNWGAKEFTQELRGMEAGRVSVKIGGAGNISVQPLADITNRVTTGSETLGLSLSLSHEFLPKQGSTRLRPALVEPILKLLAIGGFPQLSGKYFPPQLLALDGKPDEMFKIDELLKGTTSFAVPDTFTGNPDFFMDRTKAKRSASVGAQAELLRGLARQIRFHRDWEKNIFDDELSTIQVEDIAPEIPKGAVEMSFFPKELIFALALGDSAAILQNMIRPSSTAFLVMPDGELMWGDRYKEIADGKLSAVAGLVSIENGIRGKTVRTGEIARYILALSEFLDATEGIEQTKASPLLATDSDGKRILDELNDGRRYMRLLQMGLTNFLVSQAQQKDGSMISTFSLEGGHLSKVDGALSLEDQALAIRALNASARSLELPIFRWAALDTYYAMNKKFWDPNRQFYTASVGGRARALSLREVTLTLLAGNELAPHMKAASQAQWEKISGPWITAIEGF